MNELRRGDGRWRVVFGAEGRALRKEEMHSTTHTGCNQHSTNTNTVTTQHNTVTTQHNTVTTQHSNNTTQHNTVTTQ